MSGTGFRYAETARAGDVAVAGVVVPRAYAIRLDRVGFRRSVLAVHVTRLDSSCRAVQVAGLASPGADRGIDHKEDREQRQHSLGNAAAGTGLYSTVEGSPAASLKFPGLPPLSEGRYPAHPFELDARSHQRRVYASATMVMCKLEEVAPAGPMGRDHGSEVARDAANFGLEGRIRNYPSGHG